MNFSNSTNNSDISYSYPFQNPDLPRDQRIENLLSLLTLKEKINFLVDLSEAIPRLGIKKYYHGNECLHGVVRPGRATVFPQAIAFAATWDPELIHQIGTAVSDEARAKHHAVEEYPGTYNGLLTFWSPTVNMARDPRWGRTPETYGEDPFLTGRIGVNYVKGLQGDHPRYLKVVSTPKHYVGNNEEKNRFKLKPNIPEKWLRDYFLLGFKACIIEGKAASIMGAYNAVFDVPCCHSPFLLKDVLRKEWGFNGYAVTDCGGVAHALPYAHKIALTPTKAAASSINAGIDLECGPIFRKGYLEKAVKKGYVTEERINEAVTSVLRARFRLGMFDPADMNPYAQIPFSVVGSEKHSNLALKCAEESIVLLKNEEIDDETLLPLQLENYKSIAVVGPNADIAQFGDYSGVPFNTPITPLMGLKKILNDKGLSETIKLNYIPWIPQTASKDFMVIPSRNLRPTDDCKKNYGLVRYYYPKPNFKGESSSYLDESLDQNYRSESPDPTISNAQTDSNEDINLSVEKFSIIWKGYICPDISGEYKIRIHTKEKIFGKKASFSINGDKFTRSITTNLEENQKYSIEVRFPSAYLGSSIRLEWKLPNYHGEGNNFNFTREMKAANSSDIVLCYSGLSWGDEHEGVDRKDFQLSEQQKFLIRAIHKENKKIILILIAGSNLSINWEQNNIPAILHAWYPGERGGDAIANILTGEVNPSGRLPLTFYENVHQIPSFDDYELSNGKTYWFLKTPPLYPFGFGLSYTTFSYSNLQIVKQEYRDDETIEISVDVTNNGDLDGDEVVQAYISFPNKDGKYPIKQLKGFQRLHIPKDTTKTARISIPISSIAFWNLKTQMYEVEKGEIEIQIGSSSQNIHLSRKLIIV